MVGLGPRETVDSSELQHLVTIPVLFGGLSHPECFEPEAARQLVAAGQIEELTLLEFFALQIGRCRLLPPVRLPTDDQPARFGKPHQGPQSALEAGPDPRSAHTHGHIESLAGIGLVGLAPLVHKAKLGVGHPLDAFVFGPANGIGRHIDPHPGDAAAFGKADEHFAHAAGNIEHVGLGGQLQELLQFLDRAGVDGIAVGMQRVRNVEVEPDIHGSRIADLPDGITRSPTAGSGPLALNLALPSE